MTPIAHKSLTSGCCIEAERWSVLIECHDKAHGVKEDVKVSPNNHLHWLAMSRLLENLRCHVAGSAAGGGEHMEGLFIHDARQTKVGNEQIGIVLGRAEEQILGLEIAMHNAVLVKVGYCGQSSAHQVRSIRLVVAALAAYPIKELASQRQVRDQVYFYQSIRPKIPTQNKFELRIGSRRGHDGVCYGND